MFSLMKADRFEAREEGKSHAGTWQKDLSKCYENLTRFGLE